MFAEILKQSWEALRRNPARSLLTMLGIVWGIVAVAVLLAYGNSFRSVLVAAFDAFGKSAVTCWPGQTSEQAGGERAGKPVKLEREDMDLVRADAPMVKGVSLETVRWRGISYGGRLVSTAIRGVYPDYGEIRNEVPNDGRWFTPDDCLLRRRVAFLGGHLKEQLFSGRPAAGETVTIDGMRFMVAGTMSRKIQLSDYFSPDDDSVWIPYTTAGDLWDTRYAEVFVFSAINPRFEEDAIRQVREIIGKRHRFSPTDTRA
ncbi:MAG: ABC transporter permease, partial [Bryobacteraceae bacterium]